MNGKVSVNKLAQREDAINDIRQSLEVEGVKSQGGKVLIASLI